MTEKDRPHASLKPGSPLWPIFTFLRKKGEEGATSLELAQAYQQGNYGDVLNVSVAAADIRKVASQHGYQLLPAKYQGLKIVQGKKRKVYRYWVIKQGAPWPPEATERRKPARRAKKARTAPPPPNTEPITDQSGQSYFVRP